MKNNPTTINILGNKLTLNCPEGEEELLISSVETLEQKIELIFNNSNIKNKEQALIFVCLNLCREQLKLERQYSQNERNIEEKVKKLNLFLENALQ